MFSLRKPVEAPQPQQQVDQVHLAFQSLVNLKQPMKTFSALTKACSGQNDVQRQNDVLLFSQLYGLPAFAGIGRLLQAESYFPRRLRWRDGDVKIGKSFADHVSVVFAALTVPDSQLRHVHAIVRQGIPSSLRLVSFEAAPAECHGRSVAERVGKLLVPSTLP